MLMDDKVKQFQKDFPGVYFIYPTADSIGTYLKSIEYFQAGEHIISLDKPGEGNMNFVIRVITNQRRFILKQARPWVEKYPHIPAPIERNAIESAFYSTISGNALLLKHSPHIIYHDPASFIILMTDLGESSDYLNLYERGKTIEQDQLNSITNYLTQLHKISPAAFPDNWQMRLLNQEHIFKFPFRKDNGFDLNQVQQGLAPVALKYIQNKPLVDRITALGDLYLEHGDVLCHGDFYPGCWLNTTDGLKIIDPEFSFPGFREFDLGMMVGHLIMALQPHESIDQVISAYKEVAPISIELVFQIAGVSILRRILGVAQLPLPLSLHEKEVVMDQAVQWITS